MHGVEIPIQHVQVGKLPLSPDTTWPRGVARNLLGRPKGGLMFYPWCILFFSPRVLWAPSTDRPETLPHGRNLAVFYNPTPKIRGGGLSPKKIWGPKTCKISVNFGPLQTLIANISGTAQDIQNWKANVSRSIPPAFNGKDPVNFGPLITKI